MNALEIHNDVQLAKEVSNALRWHNAFRENKIQIKVKDGWLTLEGEVDWEFQKEAALSMVKNLDHIRGIINKIIIVPGRAEFKTRQVFNCFSL